MTPVPESSKVSASEWNSMSETERDSLLAREEAAFQSAGTSCWTRLLDQRG